MKLTDRIDIGGGVAVSPAALGAMNFGTATSREDAFAVLDAYVGAGGNFIDTSNNYAHWAGTGDESETLLGEWLESRGCRDDVVIATKVGFDRHGTGAGLRREQIEYWAGESLRKLRTDRIDVYYAHTDDTSTPLGETAEAFASLVREGKVRLLGCSNFDTWRVADATAEAERRGLPGYRVMQQRFTYLYARSDMAPKYIFNETAGRERLRFLYDRKMPLVAYSSTARGGYADPSRLPPDLIAGKRYDFLRMTASELGVGAGALAVAWMANLYRVPGMPRVIPLFSSSNPEHLKENLAGVELELTDGLLDELCRA